MHWVVRPLASVVLGLWVINAYVWADAWTVLRPDENACRDAIYSAAVAAQTVDPSVREIPMPKACRGFTGEQLATIAASLAAPEPTATPSPSPTATPASPSATVRHRTPSPSPTAASPSPTATPSPSATADPTTTPSVSTH